jgi:hypothetical protein
MAQRLACFTLYAISVSSVPAVVNLVCAALNCKRLSALISYSTVTDFARLRG